MRFKPNVKPLLLVFMLSVFSSASMVASASAQEIEHLLNFVGESNCVFIRNGEEHSAKKAREHMANKYSYGRIWVDDGDDFIRGIATESSTKGEKYKIRYTGIAQYSGDWLKAELARYRSQH